MLYLFVALHDSVLIIKGYVEGKIENRRSRIEYDLKFPKKTWKLKVIES